MEESKEESKEEELSIDLMCPICSGAFRSSTPTFVCEHKFCQECIVAWNRECISRHRPVTCPICRKIDNVWGK